MIIEQQLTDWYHQALGQSVAHGVNAVLGQILPRCFGYSCLQIGGPYIASWLSTTSIKHHIYLNNPALPTSNLVSSYDELPLASDSIDLVILPHTLEYSPRYREILRECQRVLVPEGNVIIIGINPFSLWGIGAKLRRAKPPWQAHYHSPFKLSKGLGEFDLQIVNSQSIIYRPPVANSKYYRRLAFLEQIGKILWPYPGGIYIIHAQKQITKLTPIRPLLKFRNYVIGSQVEASNGRS